MTEPQPEVTEADREAALSALNAITDDDCNLRGFAWGKDRLAEAFASHRSAPSTPGPAIDVVLGRLRELVRARSAEGAAKAEIHLYADGVLTIFVMGADYFKEVVASLDEPNNTPDAALREAFPEWKS